MDEHSPGNQEAPGYWLGVSQSVGDLMTFNIWSDKTKKVLQRSAIRTADPRRGAIPNERIVFDDDNEEEQEPEVVEPDTNNNQPIPLSKHGRTNKHKVRWHDAPEATLDQEQGTVVSKMRWSN